MNKTYKRIATGSSIIFGITASTLTIFAHPALFLIGIGIIALCYHSIQKVKLT